MTRDTRLHRFADLTYVCKSCTTALEACAQCVSHFINSNKTTAGQIFTALRSWNINFQGSIDVIVNKALSMGISVTDRDALTDMTLLHYAACAGSQGFGAETKALTAVQHLLSLGSSTSTSSRWSSMTPLHYATLCDCENIVHALLAHSGAAEVAHRIQLQTDPDDYKFETAKNLTDLLAQAAQNVSDEADQQPMSKLAEVLLGEKRLQIGDRVRVKKNKCATLAFCGDVAFASGIWVGLVLDRADGRNDGSVRGKRYFRCQQKHGLFLPLNRVERLVPPSQISFGYVDRPIIAGKGSVMSKTETKEHIIPLGSGVQLGDKYRGVVLFYGETQFAAGKWYGIQLEAAVGRNDGSVDGVRYFQCEKNRGLFAPPGKVKPVSK